jgi:hypothetical protein
MALSSNIPTSFVPSSNTAPRRFRSDLTGMFGLLSYFVLAVVFILALGVFFYGRVLAGSQASKDAELAIAESGIDSVTVETFVRLRDRLNLGQTLLNNHVAFSGFFSLLETLVPAPVRFISIHLSIGDTGSVKLEGSGSAKNFNALAAASTAFAHDGRIKDAIFSNIEVNSKDSSVSFALSASLDPKLIAFSPRAQVLIPSAPIATTTATSTKPTP